MGFFEARIGGLGARRTHAGPIFRVWILGYFIGYQFFTFGERTFLDGREAEGGGEVL